MSVLAEIAQERAVQEAKWGELVDLRRLTWRDILREEVYAALVESDPGRQRAELIQVAAVAIAWVGALDRQGVSV